MRDGFWQTCTKCKLHCQTTSQSPQPSGKLLLVTDSLRDSACVKGAHQYKFKDQMCCPGYQRRSNTDEIMKSSFSCHRNCLLWTFSICHLVNGSLVIFQPSPVVSTNVVPLASPAISNTGMSQSELRCIRLFYYAAGTYAIYFRNPGTLETIDVSWHMLRAMWLVTKQSVWTLRNFGRYSRIFHVCQKETIQTTLHKESEEKCDTRWYLADLHQLDAAQSNDISISSAIWQVLLVTDSLRDSACVWGAHRRKFSHGCWNKAATHVVRNSKIKQCAYVYVCK